MKNVEPSTPNDNESSNSNDKKTKVDSANAEGGDTSPAISNNGKGEPNGADNVGTASDASKPSSSLLTSVDSSKAVSKAKKTLKDKNLAKMSTIPSKSTITDGAVSEKGSLESSGPKTQSKKGSDSPTKLSNEDAKIIEELKSLRSEISKLDSSEGDDDGNDDSNEKGDENTKEKEGGGVQRSRSLIAVTAQENFLIVRGQTPPRSDSSLSLNSKSTKEGETNGDSSDSKIHSQKHELKSDSEATNGEAGEKSEEQTDQSGPKEQTALDQSIPVDGEKGSPGAEDSGGKASTEGSGEKSAEGPAVSEGTEKDEEKEGKEDSSDVDKGKEGDSDKVTESEKNPDQVSESDKNKENDDEKEEKSENVNEEEAEKSSEKTSDPEKVHDEGSSDDKEKDSEKDTEKVEKDDKSADKVEAQEDSDEVKEEETKEAGETEKKDQNSEKKDQNSEKKEGSETEDKDKNTDKKDESPEKDGEEKSPSQESDAKSPNSRGDVIVEALEESARSNTGDLADPALAEKTDETEMPFHLKPRGPSMASVERPENVISTVSMAVANNTALGAGTRTVGLGDQLTGGRPYLDRFDASDSLWQKSHGPLEVKPPTELGPNKPVGSLDDEMAQWNNKVKESRGAQTVRIKNQEPRHSILKTTDAKYGNAASKKDEIRPSLKDKALHLSEPIIIASGIVPESLEYLTSEYQAAINGKLNVNAKTGNNTNNGNKGTVLNPLSTTGNKNGNNKVAFNNAFDNSGGGNNYYNINNTSYNNGSNAVPYGQTGVAGYNSYNNANNKIGTMNATNLNPAHAGKEREQFQDRYYDNAPVANGLITAPLAVPQLKGGQAEDVFDRLHNNKKNDRNPGNAPGAVTNTKVDVPPKATTGKEPLDAKATMKAAAKTAATGNAVVAAVNNNKNTSASDANRKNQKNAAGGVVGGGVVGGGGGAGGGGTAAAAAAAGGGAGGDVFSRLYQAPKKRSDKVADDKAPSDDAKKDGTKNPVRANNAKGIANAKKGQGDSVINMPLLTPDIVVDDTGDPAPIHGANMGQGGQSGDPTKIPIVLLQGFFRGPGAKSPHHRRPSLAVSEMALPPDLVDVTSMIRGALPVLPRSLAALCLTLNIVVPGLGTMLSGWLGICWGRNRLAPVETGGTRMTSVVVTGVTGLVQLFTVTFFLVGWFWGVAWGILLVSISNKYASFCSEHRSSISGSVNLEMLTVNAS
ncbi:uncharacterized protein [Macrobrachium rosenbergii]|uniref:uncharacterized protein isoform X2 n=1 Tax=Macrobrachium rosenbergii TaxID=79674 RepID=UPI0034D592D6